MGKHKANYSRVERELLDDGNGGMTAAARRHDAVEQIARVQLDLVAADGQFRVHRRKFLAASRGLDRGEIVHAAAVHMQHTVTPRAALADTELAIWHDLYRLFGWRDVATLEPRG